MGQDELFTTLPPSISIDTARLSAAALHRSRRLVKREIRLMQQIWILRNQLSDNQNHFTVDTPVLFSTRIFCTVAVTWKVRLFSLFYGFQDGNGLADAHRLTDWTCAGVVFFHLTEQIHSYIKKMKHCYDNLVSCFTILLKY